MTMSNSTSPDAIEAHYDISNDFYALWLDETMTYSAALWAEPSGSLGDAQRAKYAHHLDLAKITEGDRLLDIGCGWGGLLNYALDEARAGSAVGLTLSRAQQAYISARPRPGLQVALESWEAHEPVRPYDGIVSIGAFEHFITADTEPARRIDAYEGYFRRCHGLLRPGASMSLQTIAYDGAMGTAGTMGAFLTGDIFPGSTLPRLAEITAACDPYFSVREMTGRPDDYARTLVAWSERLASRADEAKELVGPAEFRRYRVYLRACAAMFERGAATLYRIGMRRRDEPLGSRG